MKIRDELSLYIHIPFCVKKCNYCDFLSFSASKEMRASYIDALCAEIEYYGQRDCSEVVTVYFGGGTPSLLTGEQLSLLLNQVRKNFRLSDQTEITMEMNPGTIREEHLIAYKEAGVNRISFGLQSTYNDELKDLGRIHTYEEFLENYSLARSLGFENISIDLMSALPNQSLERYQTSLYRIARLKPEHISTYSLILEENTPFYYDSNVSKSLPDEDTERRMYYVTKEILKEYGYSRYEISNYSKEGMESRHNVGYWTNRPYIGLGLGASSYYNLARFSNVSDLSDYVYRWKYNHGSISEHVEEYHLVTEQDMMEEMMFLGLRMSKGISIEEFSNRFAKSIYDVYGNQIHTLESQGLLSLDGTHLALTDKGIDVSNYVFSEFLL